MCMRKQHTRRDQSGVVAARAGQDVAWARIQPLHPAHLQCHEMWTCMRAATHARVALSTSHESRHPAPATTPASQARLRGSCDVPAGGRRRRAAALQPPYLICSRIPTCGPRKSGGVGVGPRHRTRCTRNKERHVSLYDCPDCRASKSWRAQLCSLQHVEMTKAVRDDLKLGISLSRLSSGCGSRLVL